MAYVTNSNGNTVSVINTASNTVTATIPVGNGPASVVVALGGTRAFTANGGDDTISVIDTASNTVVATIPVPNLSSTGAMGITPDGKTLYLPSFNGNVFAISTVTNSAIATIPISGQAELAAVTADGAHVYVVCVDSFSVIDTATNTVSAGPVPVQSDPGRGGIVDTAIAFSLSGNLVYMPGAVDPSTASKYGFDSNNSTELIGKPGQRGDHAGRKPPLRPGPGE